MKRKYKKKKLIHQKTKNCSNLSINIQKIMLNLLFDKLLVRKSNSPSQLKLLRGNMICLIPVNQIQVPRSEKTYADCYVSIDGSRISDYNISLSNKTEC